MAHHQSTRACFVAHPNGSELILCKHILDVLSCTVEGMESKSFQLHEIAPICEDSETKGPIKEVLE